MSKLLYFFIIIVIATNVNSKENLFTGELIIENFSNSRTIVARIYPVSCVFNGTEEYVAINHFRYDLRAVNPSYPPDIPYNFINGRNQSTDSFTISSNSFLELNHDLDATVSNTDACVGFGKYKIVISWFEGEDYKFDTCTVEWDAGYGIITNFFVYDLYIYFRDEADNPRLNFFWSGGTREYPITYVNKAIFAWDQLYGKTSQTDSVRRIRNKQFGNFIYDTTYNNNYTIFPQDSRKDGSVSENQNFYDNRSGVLTLNLTIDKNISTRDTLLDNPTNILITKNVLLRFNDGKVFNMTTPSFPSGGYTNLIIGQDSAKLQLRPGSTINVYSPNKITLDSGGFLLLNPNSNINVYPGAYFCNEGGSIRGSGKIIFLGGYHQEMCHYLSDYLMQDSVKFILDSNAVVSVPNNTTLHLKGNTTSLIMNPGSKLFFGENSGIICDSGGKLIANNATFASSDSTKKWNGISLSDLSQDTIKNCTIKNAMYGICVSDKYDAEDTGIPYSTEISGCSFVNQTNYVLNNGVYIAGSNNVLIMNNTISSTSLEKGFTHGIYAEYCPEGNFDIINNTISNSGNGMTLIGCSPFAAQNTLTGNEYFDCF